MTKKTPRIDISQDSAFTGSQPSANTNKPVESVLKSTTTSTGSTRLKPLAPKINESGNGITNSGSVLGLNTDAGVYSGPSTVVQTPGGDIIVNTPKNVYVNTFENITEQKYINLGSGGLTAGTVSGFAYSPVVSNVTKLGFDTSCGFGVTDLGGGLAKITVTGGGGGPGTSGYSGRSGWSGSSGYSGSTGSAGSSGYSGEVGAPGSAGASGYSGEVGAPGSAGASGYSGEVGAPGSAGASGYSGAPGAGTPSGADTEVQFNDGGSFGADPGFTYNKITGTVSFDSLQNFTTSIGVTVGQSVVNSWISLYGDLGTNVNDEYSSAVAYDTSGNIYSVGADGSTGTPFLVKYSTSGSLLAQINFTEINNYYKTGDAVQVDTSGNVYVIIGTDDAVTNFTLIKLNSSLTILWQLEFDDINYEAGVDLAFDSSGNVILLGTIDSTNVGYVTKISAAGSIVWQRTLTGTTNSYPTGLTVDSTGNIYINSQDQGAIVVPYLIKYNSAGVLQWQRQFTDGVNSFYSGQVGVDSTGNIYTINGYYGYGYVVVKWDSTGAILWQNYVTVSPGNPVATSGLSIDGSDNIYVSVEVGGIVHIHKFDGTGLELWQRTLTGSDGIDQYYYWSTQNLAVNSSNYIVSGYTYTPSLINAEAIVAQFPTDGFGTSSPGNFIYGVGDLFIASGSLVESAGTLVDAAGSLTPVAGTFSTSVATGTLTLTPVTGVNDWYFGLDGSFSAPNYTLPGGDGSCNTVLTTNGTGVVSWQKASRLDSTGSFIVGNLSSSTGNNNIAIGYNFGCNTTGEDNIALGYQSLACNSIGNNNIGIGAYTLFGNTTGTQNIAIGCRTLSFNTTGTYNIGIGESTLCQIGGGFNNIGIGGCVMAFALNTVNNTAVGTSSLRCAGLYADCNTALGWQSLYNVVCGSGNIGVGTSAGCSITYGSNNTVIGSLAGTAGMACTVLIGAGACERIKVDNAGLCVNGSLIGGAAPATPTSLGTVFGYTTGNGNTAIGCCSSQFVSAGCNNVSIGCKALTSITATGCNNIAIGYCALNTNTFGKNNFAAGFCALAKTTGNNNIAVGCLALANNTLGCSNIALGYYGQYYMSGSNAIGNISLGQDAMVYSTGTENIAIGCSSLWNNRTGNWNIAIGKRAMMGSCGGEHNIAIGEQSLYGVTTGCANIAIGCRSMVSNTAGHNNIALGYQSLACNSIGNNNIGQGYYALYGNTTGCNNIAVGKCALGCNKGGMENIAQGYWALKCNSSGNRNIAQGYLSLWKNTTGRYNVAVGTCTLAVNTYGQSNIAQGYWALQSNTTGSYNIGIGYAAAAGTTVGNCNIAIGFRAMQLNSTGSGNIAQGYKALYCNTTGSANIAIGICAGCNITTGSNNTVIGSLSAAAACVCTVLIGAGTCERVKVDNSGLYINGACWCSGGAATPTTLGTIYGATTGGSSVSIGYCSSPSFADGTIAIGYGTLTANTTGIENIAIGTYGLKANTIGSQNVAIGPYTLYCNTTGDKNIAIGTNALYGNTIGANNIGIGCVALQSNTTGDFNIAIGSMALSANTTGCSNVSIGTLALHCSTIGNCNAALGYGALKCVTTGSGNTSIGYLAGCLLTTGTNNTLIGCNAQLQTATSTNTITLGDANITCIRSQVTTISTLSDARDKTAVEELPLGLQFILDLRPVKFTWNMRTGERAGVQDTGFLAQEVAAVEDAAGATDWLDMVGRENPERLELKPAKLIPVLVKAVQELAEENVELRARLQVVENSLK